MSNPKAARETSYLDVVLSPHRSLSPRGFYVLMAFVAVVCFGAGLGFLAIGAWPIVGFLGLDVAAIYLAFRLNYRSGRLFETLVLSTRDLRVSRVHPDGRVESWRLPPNWLRVRLVGGDLGPGAIHLGSHGREIAIARFLSPAERHALVRALEEALRRWRLAPHLGGA